MAQKKFLVTGATGARGGYTVDQLLERGHAVGALAQREDDGSKRLEKMGAEEAVNKQRRTDMNLEQKRCGALITGAEARTLARNSDKHRAGGGLLRFIQSK